MGTMWKGKRRATGAGGSVVKKSGGSWKWSGTHRVRKVAAGPGEWGWGGQLRQWREEEMGERRQVMKVKDLARRT